MYEILKELIKVCVKNLPVKCTRFFLNESKIRLLPPFHPTVTVKYSLLVNSYGSISGVVINLIYTYSSPMIYCNECNTHSN